MVIFRCGDDVADDEMFLLTKVLGLLDHEIKDINAKIKVAVDPESDGLLDEGEFFIGTGFVCIQRYLVSTSAALGVKQHAAYEVLPHVNETLTFAQALNAAANFWKHSEEWHEILGKSGADGLSAQALKTLSTLEKATPWDCYTCANLLWILVKSKELELSNLLPLLVEWRDNLIDGIP